MVQGFEVTNRIRNCLSSFFSNLIIPKNQLIIVNLKVKIKDLFKSDEKIKIVCGKLLQISLNLYNSKNNHVRLN